MTFTPQTHKTAHHGRQRLIFIGPRGQEILQPYLASLKDDGYVFRPDAAEKVRNQLRKSQRQSPMTPSQAKRKPKATPKKSAGELYLRTSYTRAITRACKLAKVNEWAPNQLRHNAATELRKTHGLEGTRTVDLKKGEFKPEYAGKMNFNCSAVDDLLRHEHDQPTLGLIDVRGFIRKDNS